MFGSDVFGALAFGFVVTVSPTVTPPAPSSAVVAHLAGIAPSLALTGRDVVVAVVGRAPRPFTFNTMQVQ